MTRRVERVRRIDQADRPDRAVVRKSRPRKPFVYQSAEERQARRQAQKHKHREQVIQTLRPLDGTQDEMQLKRFLIFLEDGEVVLTVVNDIGAMSFKMDYELAARLSRGLKAAVVDHRSLSIEA